MNFRTEIKPNQKEDQIGYKSNLLFIGSCFSNNIGDRFKYYKFKTITNPFGNIFNPIAIEKLIFKSLNNAIFTTSDLIFNNERWHSLAAHSDFSHADKKQMLKQLNATAKKTKQQILEATHITITLGSAWVYRHKKTNEIVANCHKISQNEFDKKLLSVKQIKISLTNVVTKIKRLNKDCIIIFTLSPVRHLKDGFIENQQSKAHLLTAIHKVIKNTNTNYFPAYEIMLDDLRDYRFYKQDMLHPNKIAIDYIWKKFKKVWISNYAQETMQKVQEIQNGLNHKPFNIKSNLHQEFLRVLSLKIDALNGIIGTEFK